MNKNDSLHVAGAKLSDSGYPMVNGIRMYYEVYGEGEALVLIHGGGSTILSNFEKIIPLLSRNRKVIAMELQAHGRTEDRGVPSSFEQDADDVFTLLKHLNIHKASFLGFSNGGTTALQIAVRHPEVVNKLVICSALAKRSGVPDWFWDMMKNAKPENMPPQLQLAYKKVAPHSAGLKIMHERDAARMVNFKDIPDEILAAVKAPVLIVSGDKDVILPEHALELHRKIKGSELAILPGGHGDYIGEITTLKPGFKESDLALPMITKFLDQEIK